MRKEILSIVPARGGSKSIPRKNLCLLSGKPLIEYTYDAVRGSKYVTRVILSTDDPEIAEHGRKNNIEVPFLRPKELATDDTPTISVIHHALEYLKNMEGYEPEIVVLLQPTSPLRMACHIDEAIKLLLDTAADSVVSVVEVPHHYNPVSLIHMDRSGKLAPYLSGEGTRILNRHEKPKIYARNGAAVYATTLLSLLTSNSLFGGDCRGYCMKLEDSVDIDSKYDLMCAEILIGKR